MAERGIRRKQKLQALAVEFQCVGNIRGDVDAAEQLAKPLAAKLLEGHPKSVGLFDGERPML